jgi:hypothetical protein
MSEPILIDISSKRIHFLKLTLLLLIQLMRTGGSQAQNTVQPVQSSASSNSYFQSLIGWHGGLQVQANHRNDDAQSTIYERRYDVSIDGYIHKLRSAFGLRVSHEYRSHEGNSGRIKSQSWTPIEFTYSPKFKFKNGISLMPAAMIELTTQYHNWYAHRFSDDDPIPYDYIHYLSVGFGGAIIFKDFYFSGNFNDLNRPNRSFYDEINASPAPATYAFLMGRVFKINKLQLTPNITLYPYLNQIGLNAMYRGMYLGFTYAVRNIELRYNSITKAGIAIGFEILDSYRFSYSFDMDYGYQMGGSGRNPCSHEIAARLILFRDRSNRQFLSNLALM